MLSNNTSNPKMSVNRNCKVTPIGVQPLKRNNFVAKNVTALKSIKFQVWCGTVLALNRFYLLNPNKILLILSYFYSILPPVIVVSILLNADDISLVYSVFKNTCAAEYVLIVLITLFASKKKMINLFHDLDRFDEMMNISNDLHVIDSGYASVFWLSGCFLYALIEYIGCYIYLTFFIDRTVYCFYVAFLTHDCEQILYFVLLRAIYLRLRIIKAHVMKVFSIESATNNYRGKLNKVEALSNNARLDVSSLHRVYDLLHKCSDQLNFIMSFPMTVILLTAGLQTTTMLKMMVTVIQTVSVSSAFGKSTIIYLFSRGMKFTGLVVVPCYYSRITSTQVSAIRTILHDAINSFPLDKIERRKVKAFFQLTRENEFTYALFGVIRLNMSLPLSYMSLCTTYLVISIQFSKFFD